MHDTNTKDSTLSLGALICFLICSGKHSCSDRF